MARKPQVRYFDTRKAYFTQFRGKQHKLAVGPDDAPTGPTYLEALEKFGQLLRLDQATTAGSNNTVDVVAELYLRYLRDVKKVQPETFSIRQRYVSAFVNGGFGKRLVGSLVHQEVYAFCNDKRTVRKGYCWDDGSVRNCLDSLQACFNWAVKSLALPRNPLKGIESPSASSRGVECVVSPEVHKKILKYLSRQDALAFRQLVIALENSGARPSEITNATAADWNDTDGCLVYRKNATRRQGSHKHKTAKSKDRCIFFTGEALDMMRQLVAIHPTGYLFHPSTKRHGKRARLKWKKKEVNDRWRSMRDKLQIAEEVKLYGYRHAFATTNIKAGMSVDTLACLMGNTAAIIRLHYSHLLDDKVNLRAQLEHFKKEAASK